MERVKLKLTVIVLLALVNLVLVVIVVSRLGQAELYQREGRDQALIYLERHGITAQAETIPWESALLEPNQDLQTLIFPDSSLPPEGMAETWEVQPMAQPETLLVDFVGGLEDLGASCRRITSVTEGYAYTSQGDRAVLTPLWQVETDQGIFRLDCASGELSRYN